MFVSSFSRRFDDYCRHLDNKPVFKTKQEFIDYYMKLQQFKDNVRRDWHDYEYYEAYRGRLSFEAERRGLKNGI